MRYPRLRLCLAGCAFFLASASHATSYDIDTTEDAPVDVERRVEDGGDSSYRLTVSHFDDGKCSLREALVAINYQIEVDSCEAGTGADTINLQEDTVYTLTEGELTVGGGKQVAFKPQDEDDESDPEPVSNPEDDKTINVNVRLVLALESFEEADDKIKPVIITDDNARLFNVKESARQLSLENLTLKADEGSAPSDDDGGLIRADSDIALGEGMLLQGGNVANRGGAIYLDKNANLLFNQDARFLDNRAAKGAAIATSATFEGGIVGERFYMAGNEAEAGGGVIYLDGEPDTLVSLGMSNGTISNNSGGAIRVDADEYQAVFQNLTLAFNNGAALRMVESQHAPQGNSDFKPVQIYNTALIGNDKGCVGDAFLLTSDPTLLFTITDDDANCPPPEEAVPVTTSPNGATSDVLIGADDDGNRQVCDSGAKGKGGCQPLLPEVIGGNLPAFLPNPEPDGLDSQFPEDTASLFDRGNPENAAADQCAAKDVRGRSRGGPGGRCDVGSVEFLRAQAEQDEVELISGSDVLADVLANDRNDTQVDCSRVSDGPCLKVLVDPARGAAAVKYRCKNTAGETVTEAVDQPPTCPDSTDRVYPYVHYQPQSDFYGVDRGMRYVVPSAAFIGGVTQGQDINTTVNLVAAPSSGLTDSSSIGASGGVSLLLLMVAGLLRRFFVAGRALAALGVLMVAGNVLAADIRVDSLADPEVVSPGNGVCTLRKAVRNANNVDPTSDCRYGDKGEDRILLPAGTITLHKTLSLKGAVIFEGQGAYDGDPDDDDDTLTAIEGDGTFRLFNVEAQLGAAFPATTFRYLTLSKGNASQSLDDGNGGVLLTGGTAVFERVVLQDNHADGNGGVISVMANAGNKKTIRFENSYVSGNTAGGSGGVFYSVAQNEENVTLELFNSTFEGNKADVDGGVLDGNLAQGSLDIINSTFVDNKALKGSALALDGLGINRARLINLTLLGNGPGLGIDLGDSDTAVTLSNSILAASGNSCSSGGAELASSAYNLFSAAVCAADNETENTSDPGAATVLKHSVEGQKGSTNDYLPPYLPVEKPSVDLNATAPLVINQGNSDDELSSGTGGPLRCRVTDKRGVGRTSGGACDRGAVEYQQITANDDTASNTKSTPDRRVLIDILDNDIVSDGADVTWLDSDGSFDKDVVGFEDADVALNNQGEPEASSNNKPFVFNPSPEHPTRYTLHQPAVEGEPTIDVVWRNYNEGRDGFEVACGQPLPQAYIDNNSEQFSDGDVAEACIVLYDPADTVASNPDSGASAKQVCPQDDDNWEPPKVAFMYQFTDSEGQQSDLASAIMTITNRPPELEDQSLLNKPGETLVFQLAASDPDGGPDSINWKSLVVAKDGEPDFTQTGESRSDVVGTGLLINEPEKGQVSYLPKGNFNTFKDTFQLTVEDECGARSNAATFTVRYPEESASGGDLGGAGWGILGVLLLLSRRRPAA